jgi:hypothetical protein
LQDAITLTQQLKYYKEYQSKLAAVAGRAKARSILTGAMYVVSTGTGDFLQNYYHNASLSRRYNVDQYCDHLVGIFSNFASVSATLLCSSFLGSRLAMGFSHFVLYESTRRSCTSWGHGGSASRPCRRWGASRRPSGCTARAATRAWRASTATPRDSTASSTPQSRR